MQSRQNIWNYHIQQVEATQNYWFGNGRTEIEMLPFDSGFVSAYVTGGLFCLAAHIGIYLLLILTPLIGLLRCRRGPYAFVLVVLAGMWGAMIVYEITAGFASTGRLGSFLAAIMGLVVATWRSAIAHRESGLPVAGE